jgi:micrococcal nuclease
MRLLPWLAAAALLLGAFVSALGARAQSAPPPASVINVVDGDTVDVQLEDGTTERIRLIGIDTPEVLDPRTPVQCFGREASAHAHELLDGQAVGIEFDPSQGERDIYGRLLAYVWLSDGRNLGEVMIADGFAHEYTYDQPYAYVDAFRAAQDLATASQAGLWSPATCAGDTTRPAGPPPVAEAPQPEPTPAPAAPAFQPVAPAPKPAQPSYTGRYDPFGPDRDCGHFSTHAEAQAFFLAAGGPATDRHRLDADRDGVACETLP